MASALGVPGSVFADPDVLSLDAAAPLYDVAGCGSILLLDGWGRVERGDDGSYVWARAEEARVEIPRPVRAEIGESSGFLLTMEIGTLLRSDQPQAIEVRAAGRSLGRRELEGRWDRVEFEVPPEALSEPWNELTFHFDWALSPKDLGQSGDNRTLAAALRRLALRPKAARRAPLATLEPSNGGMTLRIPPGAVVTWPLPRNASGELALRDETPEMSSCAPSVQLLGADGSKEAGASKKAGASKGTGGSTEHVEARWISGPPRHLEIAFSTGASWSRLALGCPRGTGEARLRLPEKLPQWEVRRPSGEENRYADVFLYLVDTLRADSLSVYGGPHPTPHLAELADDGVTYEQAWTASTWTLPATVSLLTGVTPAQHGVTTGHRKLSQSSVVPLAERLDAQGFFTLGLSQSIVASERFGVDRGFDHFRTNNHLGSTALRSNRLRQLLLRYLLSDSEAAGAPLFVYLHSVDPHDPYRPTDGFESLAGEALGPEFHKRFDPHAFNLAEPRPPLQEVETMRQLYDAEVAWADQQFGRLLALLRHLDLYEGSFVVFTSDHGEEFDDHGAYGHGRTVYEEQLRVPLVVRFPDARNAGSRVDRPVSTMDLAPTILSRMEFAQAEESDFGRLAGRPLSGGAASDAEERWLLGVVSPLAAPPLHEVDYVAFRRGDLKCIRANLPFDQFGVEIPRWQVFDLAADPGEQSPLPADDPRYYACIEAWKSLRNESAVGEEGGNLQATDEETLEELRALGYIGEEDG